MALRQTLRSLCLKSGWCYAVFWRLKRRSRMVLTYEDGYYDGEKPLAASNWTSLPFIMGNHASSENNSMYEHERYLCVGDITGADDQIGLAVAKMSYQVYPLGEGIVGRVAFNGRHHWMFSGEETNNAMDANTYSTWWASQLTAGIKTVAVVAVAQGVVQLGSTYVLAEDTNLVCRIRSLFATLQNGYGNCFSKSSETVSSNAHAPLASTMNGLMTTSGAVDRSSNSGISEQDSLVDIQRTNINASWNNSLATIGNVNKGIHFTHRPHFTTAAKALTTHNESYTESFSHHSQNKEIIHPLTSSSSDAVLAHNRNVEMLGSSSSSSSLSSCISNQWNVKELMSSFELVPSNLVRQNDMQYPSIQCLSPSSLTLSSAVILSQAEEASEIDTDKREELGANILNSSVSPTFKCSDFEEHFIAGNHLLQTNDAAGVSISQFENPGFGSSNISPFGVLASTQITNQEGWERDVVKKNSSPVGEKDVQFSVPSHVDVQDLKVASIGVCKSSFGGSWFSLDALNDIDAYLEPVSFTPSQPVICDELSEVLLPTCKKGSLIGTWDTSKDGSEENDKTKFIKSFEYTDPLKSSIDCGPGQGALPSSFVLDEATIPEIKVESLLEAVVAGLGHVSKTSLPNSTGCSIYRSQSPALGNFDSSRVSLPVGDPNESKTLVTPMLLKSFNSRESVLSGSACDPDAEVSIKVHSVQEPTEASSSVQMEEGSSRKCQESAITESLSVKRTEELSKGGRKRARPNEASRPRPKDRQQIQDRVRELREIVPNGAKCSIDALLERTIRYMHFLQTVTQHGCRWKDYEEEVLLEKVQDSDSNIRGRKQLENNSSWALELGGQGFGCPIVVKNSSQPGQLLVQMTCDEKGLFLEIADTIRNLGLTILKGVMESRNDKIQACFIVEATMDVHRVQILLALTQLLQPTAATRSAVTTQGGFESQSMDRHSIISTRSLDKNSVMSIFHQDSLGPLYQHLDLH